MITPNEIKDQCLKWWREILISAIDADCLFPREITRIGKIMPTNVLLKLTELKTSIQLLKDNSKEYKGYGYKILFIERDFDKIGKQQVPDKIIIETLEDYLKLTSKQKEYDRFLANLSLITSDLSILIDWSKNNVLKLIEHDSWKDTLKVCKYFIDNPKPNVYIRQLPIDVHTKYIQENKSLIQLLLEYLISNNVNYNENKFELRFNLKYAEPLLRIRFLDQQFSPIPEVSDISFTLSEFSVFECKFEKVFVTENLMNFLTLPNLTKTIAIWSGGGFNVSYLKEIKWLRDKQFYYWGDIDAQGFQILNQFRTYFSNTIAVMMDEQTFKCFKSAQGVPCTNQKLQMLTDKEFQLYTYLKDNNLRLEQEKITQSYANEQLFTLLNEKATVS